MVRELLEQRADLAIADLTITFDREQVRAYCRVGFPFVAFPREETILNKIPKLLCLEQHKNTILGMVELCEKYPSCVQFLLQVVDFTMPFMNLGISVLYRKPVKQVCILFPQL